MDLLAPALRGARHAPAAALAPLERVLVVGAGGTLGSAVLAEALVAGRFQQVQALVAEPLASAVRGFVPVRLAQLDAPDLAIVVFERARHSNGRDDAFFAPEPAGLLALAERLHAAGLRRLVIVVPHAPALLPQALKQGFASEAEGDIARLGFTHLVFLRSAQTLAGERQASLLARLAAWWLSQLRWMVPQREQPLRAAALAALVIRLARRLAGAPAGTRVLAPEMLDPAATGDDAGAADHALDAWLARP